VGVHLPTFFKIELSASSAFDVFHGGGVTFSLESPGCFSSGKRRGFLLAAIIERTNRLCPALRTLVS
jgi:hypothetical protein